MTIDRLMVIWGDPLRGGRHVVGHLARGRGEFRFWYERSLTVPQARGFFLLPPFAEHRTEDDPYVARYLFGLFAGRIPHPHRSDTRAMLESWGVESSDDQFEILARSGGISATDRLEFAEFRAVGDGLRDPLEFRVAGRKHLADVAPLTVGDEVVLTREPTNEADPDATIVATVGGQRAGYVPRQYSPLFANTLEGGVVVEAKVVRRLVVPDDVGRWVVRAVSRP